MKIGSIVKLINKNDMVTKETKAQVGKKYKVIAMDDEYVMIESPLEDCWVSINAVVLSK